MYNAPRAASIQARTDSILWALDRETFNNIVKEAARKKRDKYQDFLKKVDILAEIDAYELSQIADALKVSNFKAGDYIINEGERGDVFYIVLHGDLVATKTKESGKPPVEVLKYSEGSYFGELALLKGVARQANVVAVSDVTLASLDRSSFKRLLGPLEDILGRNSDKYVTFLEG